MGDIVKSTLTAKVVSLINEKGGVGKSTVTGLFAEYLAILKSKRVLLIDMDGQCNLSQIYTEMVFGSEAKYPPTHPEYDPLDDFWKGRVDKNPSISDIYYGKMVIPYPTLFNPEKGVPGIIDIIPNNGIKMESLVSEHKDADRKNSLDSRRLIERLREFVTHPSVQSEYDYIVIDSSPKKDPIFRAVIGASDYILTPYEPSELSISGIQSIISATIQQSRERIDGQSITFIGAFPNRYMQRYKHQTIAIDEARKHLGQYHVPEAIWLKDRSAISKRTKSSWETPDSIFHLKPSDEARSEAESLMEFIFKKIEG